MQSTEALRCIEGAAEAGASLIWEIFDPMATSLPQHLLEGRGLFVADVFLEGTLHAAFVRSPQAYARIASLDACAARDMPGVKLVLTAADIESLKPIEPAFLVEEEGTFLALTSRPILCGEFVQHVGDLVALVIATTELEAISAAEMITVEYDPLAIDPSLPFDHEQWGQVGNLHRDVVLRWKSGDLDSLVTNAAPDVHTTSLHLKQTRVAPAPIETRGILAYPDPQTERLTLIVPSQGAALLRDFIATCLNMPREQLRLLTFDVGGSFGMKGGNYPEYVAIAAAAQKLEKPVKWIASRSEAFQSDTQARDVESVGELRLAPDGRFLALQIRHDVDLGAYISFAALHAATHGLAMARTGLYSVQSSTIGVTGRLSHTPWTDAYRGAGKPESILLLERLVDESARELGIDRAELRRRNLIGVEELPYRTISGESYDSGNFRECLETALTASGWSKAEDRAAASLSHGRLYGIGLSCWLDVTMAGPIDEAWVHLDQEGNWRVKVGSQDSGQGHRAGFGAILSERLGIKIDNLAVGQGDSDAAPNGGATYGAKTMGVAGAALALAVDAMLALARSRAAALFGTSLDEILYESGMMLVSGSNHRASLMELAGEEGLSGSGKGGGTSTYPNGCHVCEVEIDPKTGAVEVVAYTAVDDFGPILDRATLEGQIRGGIVQGLGQALYERVVFDADGQILTGSLMDYGMPRAANVPSIHIELIETKPCTTNPVGTKGSGQAGAIGALAAAMNAVNDALWRVGATPIGPPAIPHLVWEAVQRATKKGTRGLQRSTYRA